MNMAYCLDGSSSVSALSEVRSNTTEVSVAPEFSDTIGKSKNSMTFQLEKRFEKTKKHVRFSVHSCCFLIK